MKIITNKKVVFFTYICALVILFKDGFKPGWFLSGYDIETLSLPFRIFAKMMYDKYYTLPVWRDSETHGIQYLYTLD